VLLTLYIYGYLNRVQSSRRLEREAGRSSGTSRQAPKVSAMLAMRFTAIHPSRTDAIGQDGPAGNANDDTPKAGEEREPISKLRAAITITPTPAGGLVRSIGTTANGPPALTEAGGL
jgi:hypothetical protein